MLVKVSEAGKVVIHPDTPETAQFFLSIEPILNLGLKCMTRQRLFIASCVSRPMEHAIVLVLCTENHRLFARYGWYSYGDPTACKSQN